MGNEGIDVQRDEWIRSLLLDSRVAEAVTRVESLDDLRGAESIVFGAPGNVLSLRIYDLPTMERTNGFVNVVDARRYFSAGSDQTQIPPDVWVMDFHEGHRVRITEKEISQGYVGVIDVQYGPAA